MPGGCGAPSRFGPVPADRVEGAGPPPARPHAQRRTTSGSAFPHAPASSFTTRARSTRPTCRTTKISPNPKLKGKVCTRSGSHVYNLSLMSALIEHWGEAKAEAMGQRRRGEFCARAERRRHRPDSRRGRRRMRRGDQQQLLLRAPDEIAEARRPQGASKRSRSSGPTRKASART